MKIQELLLYEAPSITEFISIGWLQSIVARYLAWKVNGKYKRYLQRLKRAELVKKNLDTKEKVEGE